MADLRITGICGADMKNTNKRCLISRSGIACFFCGKLSSFAYIRSDEKYAIILMNDCNLYVPNGAYWGNRIVFYCDDDGKLFLVRIHSPNLTQKVADYPVISPAEAMRLLSKGKYITSVPYRFSGTEFVAKAELIYRTGDLEAYFMPYYRFYVEIPEL